MHRLAAVLIGLAALTGGSAPARAIVAELVIDARTGAVIHEMSATQRHFPASLTKMMTVYLMFEDLAAGKVALGDVVTLSAHAAAQTGTRLGAGRGGTITIEEAIPVIIARSANDVSVAVAEHLEGSESAFAARMTRTARRLGMYRTVFQNASGLPDPAQTTTAVDMAVLGQALLRTFPQYYKYFGMRHARWRGRVMPTYNGLMTRYSGADGIKTGFTCRAGYNLVTSAVRDGRRLIGVVLGASSTGQRNARMAHLLDGAFAQPSPEAPGTRTVALLTASSRDSQGPPPLMTVKANACSGTAVASAGSGRVTRPSGWSAEIGTFRNQEQAKSAANEIRQRIPANLRRANLALVARPRGADLVFQRAWFTGLDQSEAMAICQTLRSTGFYCVTISPAARDAAMALAARAG